MSIDSGQSVVRPGDISPAINVVNWFIVVVTALFVGTRIVTKMIRCLTIGKDDMIILFSTIFSFALVATVTVQTANGLGKHVDTLSQQQLVAYSKAEYTGNICFVLSLLLSKVSVLLLLHLITPVRLHARIIIALGVIIIAWGSSALIVAVFQCSLPDVWKLLGNHCVDKTLFWTFFGVLNLVIEIALIILPIHIVTDVHIMHSAKSLVIAVFVIRLLVIASIIPQIIFLRKSSHSADPTFDTWPLVICSLLVQSFSIITSCVPYLKPFFASLESGMLRTDDLRRRDGTATFSNNSRINTDQIIGGRSRKHQNGVPNLSTPRFSSWPQILRDIGGQNAMTVTEAVGGGEHTQQVVDGHSESQTSLARFIQQTITWEVSHT